MEDTLRQGLLYMVILPDHPESRSVVSVAITMQVYIREDPHHASTHASPRART